MTGLGMLFIFSGFVFVAEKYFPDTHGQYHNICNSDFECEERYIGRDEAGNITKETLERLGVK